MTLTALVLTAQLAFSGLIEPPVITYSIVPGKDGTTVILTYPLGKLVRGHTFVYADPEEQELVGHHVWNVTNPVGDADYWPGFYHMDDQYWVVVYAEVEERGVIVWYRTIRPQGECDTVGGGAVC